MIVGSIYLGKQAKKAYRKRQAEKAAEKLTAPYDIADPSDEIKMRVPPSSPTESSRSLTSIPSTDLTSIKSSEAGRIKSSRSSTNLTHGLSASSSLSRQRSNPGALNARDYEQFVRRQSNDYMHKANDAPPSYDAIAGPGPTSEPREQSVYSSHDSQHSLDHSPQSMYPSWPSPSGHHSHCPECFAMMQQQMHQMHMHGHHQSFPPPIHTHSAGPMHSTPQAQYHSPKMPGAAELPDPSVYQQQPHTEASRPIAEAPDTGTYSATSGPIYEMPAELPSGFGAPSKDEETEEKQDKSDENYSRDMVKSADSSVAVSRRSEDCNEDSDNFSFRANEAERIGRH